MEPWTLEALGWRSDLDAERSEYADDFLVGRVAIEFGGLYRVLVPEPKGGLGDPTASESTVIREITAALPGKWRNVAPLETPAVGDWVALRRSGEGYAIAHRFERRTRFLRQAAGRRPIPQVVGANIDVVFVVMSLDNDFNPRRIERYLAAVLDGGASPVIVLSKADLSTDPETSRAALRAVNGDVPIEVVSTHLSRGLDRLRGYLGRGRTGALTGSSGVGKSTLVNALIGEDRQRTHEVRAHDSKGRHTTTHRELILLGPSEGLLVDTPGMRELQLWTPGDGVAQAFDDVTELAEQCRFRDCRHDGEPGCEVEAAVARGDLSAERKTSYLKLRAEQEANTRIAPRRRTGRRGGVNRRRA